MEEILKKVLYTGVGVISMTADKLKEAVDELVDKKKMSEEEGKKVVDDFEKESEARKNELEERLNSFMENLGDQFTFPTKGDWKALTERVEALEKELAEHKKAKSPSTPTK